MGLLVGYFSYTLWGHFYGTFHKHDSWLAWNSVIQQTSRKKDEWQKRGAKKESWRIWEGEKVEPRWMLQFFKVNFGNNIPPVLPNCVTNQFFSLADPQGQGWCSSRWECQRRKTTIALRLLPITTISQHVDSKFYRPFTNSFLCKADLRDSQKRSKMKSRQFIMMLLNVSPVILRRGREPPISSRKNHKNPPDMNHAFSSRGSIFMYEEHRCIHSKTQCILGTKLALGRIIKKKNLWTFLSEWEWREKCYKAVWDKMGDRGKTSNMERQILSRR